MTRTGLLYMLPEYRDQWVVIKKEQTVRSIIREVLAAHKDFTSDYDLIAGVFEGGDVKDICARLQLFCLENIQYAEEGDDDQTTSVPAGILTRGYGDCKHYSGFCGGILDALNRRGYNIDWNYRFASYRVLDPVPHHVFIVVKNKGEEIWIDPTPNVSGKYPVWQEDHKIKKTVSMLRRNIAGVEDDDVIVEAPGSIAEVTEQDLIDVLQDIDTSVEMSQEELNATINLYNFQVIDEDGNLRAGRMDELKNLLPADLYDQLSTDYSLVMEGQTIGNIFKKIWGGVKAATLSIPRNAYLGLVALNVFGMASKLSKLWNDTDTKGKDKIWAKWESLGGRGSALEAAIKSGAKKKPLLGKGASVGAAPAVPAWLAVAGGIIAAIMPLVNSILKEKNQYNEFANLDQLPGGYNQYDQDSGGIMGFIRSNPLIVVGGAALLAYFFIADDK